MSQATTFAPGGLAGWAMTMLRRAGQSKPEQKPELEALSTLSLGGRRQLALVECQGRQFLVGMSADAVTSIASIEQPSAGTSRTSRWEPGY